jgi:hypothetical protein
MSFFTVVTTVRPIQYEGEKRCMGEGGGEEEEVWGGECYLW